jgi:hypothetical protein
MHLLKFNNDRKFSLAAFSADENPQKYAILSHTWGAEVTFEDLQNGTGTKKAGYKKIRFRGEQLSAMACNTFGWTLVARRVSGLAGPRGDTTGHATGHTTGSGA